jgi:hypothetical protein
MAVRPVDMDETLGFATYKKQVSPSITEVGVMRFRMKMVPNGPPPSSGERLSFLDATTVAAFSSQFTPGFNADAQVYRVTFDPSGNYIYAAFGCNGLAVYQDASDPYSAAAPTLMSTWTLGSLGPDAVFEVERGAGSHLYASVLDRGIFYFEDLTASPLMVQKIYRVRHKAIGMHVNPADRREVYLAGSIGGFDRLYVTD